jgi:2-polyprenyl-3-methyl-5-hydroxy-6-metoxy-1,4-benzoquinol methylase
MMDAKQPTRSTRVVADRRFDKTQLRASGHGRTVHRDYAAHFFRWGWVSRQIAPGQRVLDIGCGQDQPLLYVLGQRIQTVPDIYVGVDLNRIMKKSAVKWARIFDEFDFVTNGQKVINEFGPFDIVTCFEVIEHMGTADGAQLLRSAFDALKHNGKLYLSTPVFNGAAAANHVHEYTIPELHGAIEAAGFSVAQRIGTFASKPDVVAAMIRNKDTEGLAVYRKLEGWFGGDVMSTIMAPLYPDDSRNNLWVCVKC